MRIGFAGARSGARVARVGLLLGLLLLPATLECQGLERGAFAFIVGAADTFGIENFTRGPGVLTGELVVQTMGRMTYSATIDSDAGIRILTIDYWTPGASADAGPSQAATLTVEGDEVVIDITTPSGIEPQRIESRDGVFLYLNPSFALIEQMVRHARSADAESFAFSVFMAEGAATVPARMADPFSAAPRLSIGSEIQLSVDPESRLISASIPAQRLTVARVFGSHLPSGAAARDPSNPARLAGVP